MAKKTIISCSKRTDVPAYYSHWLMDRIQKGFTHYPNPMNPSGKPVYQDLMPNAVKAIVFWSRNPRPLFKYLDIIDRVYEKKHYMHFTLNGLPDDLEIRNPKIDVAIDSIKYLADRYKKNDYVQWRFDPIVLSSISNEEYHIDRFTYISEKLKGYVSRCYFSFVDFYKKTQINMTKLEHTKNISFFRPSINECISITKKLKTIADNYNISLYACAEDAIMEGVPGINKAHCIDADLINKICDEEKYNYKSTPSRIGCGCIDSKDIGYYDSCPHGCIYCYANMNPERAFKNAKVYLERGFPCDDLSIKHNPKEQLSLDF